MKKVRILLWQQYLRRSPKNIRNAQLKVDLAKIDFFMCKFFNSPCNMISSFLLVSLFIESHVNSFNFLQHSYIVFFFRFIFTLLENHDSVIKSLPTVTGNRFPFIKFTNFMVQCTIK